MFRFGQASLFRYIWSPNHFYCSWTLYLITTIRDTNAETTGIEQGPVRKNLEIFRKFYTGAGSCKGKRRVQGIFMNNLEVDEESHGDEAIKLQVSRSIKYFVVTAVGRP